MNKLISKNLFWLIISSFLFVLLLTRVVFGWTNPSSNPPSGGGALNFSSGNVGIGNTSPSYKLDVAGQIRSSSGGFVFPDNSVQSTAFSGGSQTITAANVSSGQFGANTGGGNYYFPANVGIGTTVPGTPLYVSSSGNTTETLTLENKNASYQSYYPAITFRADSAGDVVSKIYSSFLTGTGWSDAAMRFSVANSGGTQVDAMTIKSGGNVGIGETVPTQQLQVGSKTGNGINIQIGGYGSVGSSYSGVRTVLGMNAIANTAGDNGMHIMNTNGAVGALAISMIYTEGITFHTKLGSVTAGAAFSSERMRIDNNGNVGIGTTVPGAALDVKVPAGTALIAQFQGNNVNGGYDYYYDAVNSAGRGYVGYGPTLFSSGAISDFGIRSQAGVTLAYNGGSVGMYINTSGNVGIGTASPGYKLDVAGDINFTGTLRQNGTAFSSANYWTASGNNIYNNNSGYVGIGTAAPESKFTVKSSASNSNSGLFKNVYYGTVYSILPYSSNVYLSAGIYYEGGSWIHQSDTTYNQLFDMNPVSGGGVNWYASSNGVGSWNLAANVPLWDNYGYWKNLVQSTASGNSYFTGGNVGIGTTNPAHKLIVSGGNIGVDNNYGYISKDTSGNYKVGLELNSSNYWQLGESYNVGIGTASPGYKLDVQGGQVNASGGLCIAGDCKTAWSQVGGSTMSAANVSAGSFGANTGGGNYSFPGIVNISGAYPNSYLSVPSSYVYAQDVYSYSSGKWLSQTLSGSTSNIATEGYVAAWTGTNSLGTAGYVSTGGIYLHTPAISPMHTYVGINTATNMNYDLQVNGSFAANSKSFDIQDPRYSDPKKRLVHATLEGPEDAVFYRGEAQLVNGKIIITLPDYFEALTRKENRTVLLTPKFDSETEPISQLAASAVVDGKFTVKSTDQSNPSQKFFWEVKAVRSDIAPLQVEKINQ